MFKSFLFLFATAFAPRFLFAKDDGLPRGNAGGGGTAPGQVGPGAAQPNPDRDQQLRAQARQAARTLSEQAADRARELSRSTGRTVLPEATPTEDDLFKQLQGEDNPHDTPIHATAGPNPGLVGLRPGETVSGPATGPLAVGRLVPEHQVIRGGVQPTVNAPGVGADTGLKKTADNPDARAGEGGHAEGVDPADPGTLGAQGVAQERHDTPADTRERVDASQALQAVLAKGEVPSREQFLAAGCPEGELDRAIEAAKAELDARNASDGAAASRAAVAPGAQAPAATATASSDQAGEDPKPATADDLVAANTREQLVELAATEGVEVGSGDTKPVIAENIVAKRNAAK